MSLLYEEDPFILELIYLDDILMFVEEEEPFEMVADLFNDKIEIRGMVGWRNLWPLP